ncbi:MULTISPECIES: hypothetical protein [unclassified Bradyrhizobium]|uniref:hypothetical protein n=1 Tax=unclassified Bradyrhizobium TaxID=2631580 RepID=UPI001BAA7AA6|nr:MULTISPECIES: hypothetical protein [unclassified Bradyrhizobium]MBR1207033.1 hypothetical protein [Bradyrhizobium sp. AUGA SZCCT0124]MBR1313572.1 hypothetical protein [Bradyrhizobium sp. AUGA SZCCT0051]MBR1343331.1 hypothetical protein [Bradyrhizobium sp. AUGA SZCCT0105]MBR1357249.1 hypothetical protein [Bradyrhizobium sp. AUGA SZCCT0045]
MVDDVHVTIGRANFCNDGGTFSRLRIVPIAQALSRLFRAHHESIAAKISTARPATLVSSAAMLGFI